VLLYLLDRVPSSITVSIVWYVSNKGCCLLLDYYHHKMDRRLILITRALINCSFISSFSVISHHISILYHIYHRLLLLPTTHLPLLSTYIRTQPTQTLIIRRWTTPLLYFFTHLPHPPHILFLILWLFIRYLHNLHRICVSYIIVDYPVGLFINLSSPQPTHRQTQITIFMWYILLSNRR
jgi:hypothetical protein